MLLPSIVRDLNSLGNSTFLSVTVISKLPDVYLTKDLISVILSSGADISLNNLTRLLPLLSHTQQCHGCSPFSLSVKLTSSFGLW